MDHPKALALIANIFTTLERATRDKHSSLLLICVNGVRKKFFNNCLSYINLFLCHMHPVANVIKLFLRNYVAIGVTSVKIIEKYAASGVNYA